MVLLFFLYLLIFMLFKRLNCCWVAYKRFKVGEFLYAAWKLYKFCYSKHAKLLKISKKKKNAKNCLLTLKVLGQSFRQILSCMKMLRHWVPSFKNISYKDLGLQKWIENIIYFIYDHIIRLVYFSSKLSLLNFSYPLSSYK